MKKRNLYKLIMTIEIPEDELNHLVNDLIAYYWQSETEGLDEACYKIRRALIDKLKEKVKKESPHWEYAG